MAINVGSLLGERKKLFRRDDYASFIPVHNLIGILVTAALKCENFR